MERRDIDMDKHEQNKVKNMYRICGLLMKNDNDGKTWVYSEDGVWESSQNVQRKCSYGNTIHMWKIE